MIPGGLLVHKHVGCPGAGNRWIPNQTGQHHHFVHLSRWTLVIPRQVESTDGVSEEIDDRQVPGNEMVGIFHSHQVQLVQCPALVSEPWTMQVRQPPISSHRARCFVVLRLCLPPSELPRRFVVPILSFGRGCAGLHRPRRCGRADVCSQLQIVPSIGSRLPSMSSRRTSRYTASSIAISSRRSRPVPFFPTPASTGSPCG